MFIQSLEGNPRFFFAVVITVVISITFHELAHGIVAIWQGDDTPIEQGHMTLNPLVHMGVFSIIVMLIAGIAWGSMPVDRSRLRGRYADVWVSAAGPISNILMSMLALSALGLWMRADSRSDEMVGDVAANGRYLLGIFGMVNLHLALFNLIPLPPLDGARIIGGLSHWFEQKMDLIAAYGTGPFIYLSMMVFMGAGTMLGPVAVRASAEFLQLVRGW